MHLRRWTVDQSTKLDTRDRPGAGYQHYKPRTARPGCVVFWSCSHCVDRWLTSRRRLSWSVGLPLCQSYRLLFHGPRRDKTSYGRRACLSDSTKLYPACHAEWVGFVSPINCAHDRSLIAGHNRGTYSCVCILRSTNERSFFTRTIASSHKALVMPTDSEHDPTARLDPDSLEKLRLYITQELAYFPCSTKKWHSLIVSAAKALERRDDKEASRE